MSAPDKEEIERLFYEFQHTDVKIQELFDRLDGDPVNIQDRRIRDAGKMRELREDARRGGESRRWSEERIQRLEEEVRELHGLRPHLKWTRVCDIIAEHHGVSGRTIRNRAEGARW